MKKVLSLILAFLMCLSICACDSSSNKKAKKDNDEPKATYKSAVEKWEKVMNGKSDTIESMAPKAYWTYCAEQSDMTKSEYLEYYVGDFEDEYDDMAKSWEELVGKDPKVTMEIEEKEKVDKDTVEDIAEALNEKFDIKESDVNETYELTLKMTLKGKDDTQEAPAMLYAVEIDSEWYLVNYINDDGDIYVDFHIFLF